MKILILGHGAVGCSVGALLSAGGFDVRIAARGRRRQRAP
ncbi:MAG: hypothetical protein J0H09_12675 [Burkholderiales bacterium]|nr:hypothetical protein [Burkholderiales bacterium]